MSSYFLAKSQVFEGSLLLVYLYMLLLYKVLLMRLRCLGIMRAGLLGLSKNIQGLLLYFITASLSLASVIILLKKQLAKANSKSAIY
jgi:hypothetical protein